MEDNNRMILTDADGYDVEFEFLDVVEAGGKKYMVLLPMDCAETGEVAIFRIEGDDDDQSYIGLEDEEEAIMAFEAFKEKNKDEYQFSDDA